MACALLKSETPSVADLQLEVRGLLVERAHCLAELGRIDTALGHAYEQFEARLWEASAAPPPPIVQRVLPARGSCAHAVLCQIMRGVHSTSMLVAVLPRWKRDHISAALHDLVASGWVTRSGAGQATRYDLTDVADVTAAQMRGER